LDLTVRFWVNSHEQYQARDDPAGSVSKILKALPADHHPTNALVGPPQLVPPPLPPKNNTAAHQEHLRHIIPSLLSLLSAIYIPIYPHPACHSTFLAQGKAPATAIPLPSNPILLQVAKCISASRNHLPSRCPPKCNHQIVQEEVIPIQKGTTILGRPRKRDDDKR
jgi:hypothetical protein